jgi:hypothetical protein
MRGNAFARTSSRLAALVASLALVIGVLSVGAQKASGQAPASADPQVRAAQQWEDVLLMEAFDYLQITPQQSRDLQALADYSRARMDEVEQQRARLQKALQEQHLALLKGRLPSNSDQQDVIQKQRTIADRQAAVSQEIVERVAPKLGAILTRRQTVRAWLLIQNKIPAVETKRVALTDPASGFVLPQLEGRDAIEEMVKTTLRQTYPPDVVEQALTPWEFASIASLVGGGGLAGPGGGGGGVPADRAKALQAIQEMDPRMGQRMLMLGQRMFKQFSGGSDQAAPQAPVAPEVRAAINRDAVAIRKSIETEPEAYLSQARGNQMLDALRPLARRLFLSPRIKEALTERESLR